MLLTVSVNFSSAAAVFGSSSVEKSLSSQVFLLLLIFKKQAAVTLCHIVGIQSRPGMHLLRCGVSWPGVDDTRRPTVHSRCASLHNEVLSAL